MSTSCEHLRTLAKAGVGDSHVMTLSDGRELAWTEFGDAQGWPVFGFHGTPGSRRQICVHNADARAAAVRFVTLDRPGYGLSTFQPGRRLVDWPADVEQVADHLAIGRFSVMGVSGGGPHAAACAALLKDRVAVAGIVGGAGPLAHPRIARDLTRADKVMASLARRRSVTVRLLVSAEAALASRFPNRALDLFARQLPTPDAEVLRRPEVRELFELEMAGASWATGRAWAQDLGLFASDWGFELQAIEVPVILWQGDEDRAVPLEHARLMHDEIAGSVLHVVEGEGHLFIVDALEAILRELVPPESGNHRK